MKLQTKKLIKPLLAAALAFMITLASLPAMAKTNLEPMLDRAEQRRSAPSGYNAQDYAKCVAYLEQTDETGAANGSKLSSSYDPSDPATWGSSWSGDYFAWTYVGGEKRLHSIDISSRLQVGSFDFSDCSELVEVRASDNYLSELNVSNCASLIKLSFNENSVSNPMLNGCSALEQLFISFNPLEKLDLSHCAALEFLTCYSSELTELDISCCPRLDYLSCYSNRLTELDISHCPMLSELNCTLNELGELDISHCPMLEILDCSFTGISSLDLSNSLALRKLNCSNNDLHGLDVSSCAELSVLDCRAAALSELDISQNSALSTLYCSGNRLTRLDLSNNSELAFDCVLASGSGFIGYDYFRNYYNGESGILFARPANGASFDGFFDENGALISEGEWVDYEQAFLYYFEELYSGTVFARFSGSSALPGDIDDSGSVSVSDAVTALRLAMQLIDESGLVVENGDFNENGSIAIADAVVILRIAMGLV